MKVILLLNLPEIRLRGCCQSGELGGRWWRGLRVNSHILSYLTYPKKWLTPPIWKSWLRHWVEFIYAQVKKISPVRIALWYCYVQGTCLCVMSFPSLVVWAQGSVATVMPMLYDHPGHNCTQRIRDAKSRGSDESFEISGNFLGGKKLKA
jgi:hypothetical protein